MKVDPKIVYKTASQSIEGVNEYNFRLYSVTFWAFLGDSVLSPEDEFSFGGPNLNVASSAPPDIEKYVWELTSKILYPKG